MDKEKFQRLAVPACLRMLFLGAFMVYPLIDVFVYSFEEGYNSASQTYLWHGNLQLFLCASRSVFSPGTEKYLASGGHHRAGIHASGPC